MSVLVDADPVVCDCCGLECLEFRQRDGERACIACVDGELRAALIALHALADACEHERRTGNNKLRKVRQARAWSLARKRGITSDDVVKADAERKGAISAAAERQGA